MALASLFQTPAGDQLVRALLRADTLAVYSRLCAQTHAPVTRGTAAQRSAATTEQAKVGLVLRMILDLQDLTGCMWTSTGIGLKRELITALADTQLLEHAAKALLLAAEAAPGEGAGAASAAGLRDESWSCVSLAAPAFCNTLTNLLGGLGTSAVCPRPRVKDVLEEVMHKREQLDLLEQLRPLLAGPCVQLCATWAALCTAMAAQQRAADGSVQQLLAPTSSQLRHGLPPGLMRPLEPHLGVTLGQLVDTSDGVTTTAPYSPHGQRPPQLQPQKRAMPLAGSPAAVAAAETAGTAAGAAAAAQGTQANAAVPYSAVHAYGLLYEIWGCLTCDCASYLSSMCTAGLVMARLLTELRPEQVAVRLPGWWQLLAQTPTMLIQNARLARESGHLLRLQLNAPPLRAWASEVADAASVAAASWDWPPESPAVQCEIAAGPGSDASSAAVSAKAVASLARGRDPSYSLRCALDAGLLSTLEWCLRAPQAWREARPGPHSAGSLLNVTVSLIATLGAAARLLAQDDVRLGGVAYASQPGMKRVVDTSARAYLCAYLAALLEQVADVRALRGGAQQQPVGPGQEVLQQPQSQTKQQQATERQQPSSHQAAAVAAPALHLNSALEPLLSLDGLSFDKPAHCSIAWMAAAGGLPDPSSAADRQQQLFASFAVHHWLPVLAKATEEAMGHSKLDADHRVSKALLVGRLLMSVLWLEGGTRRHVRPQADDGAGTPHISGEISDSPRPEAAWWGASQLTEELVQSMHTIAYTLSTGAVGGMLFQKGSAWQQEAALDLLQSYWTRFPDHAYLMTAEQADEEQRGGQDRAAGSSGEAAVQQPAPLELALRHVAPLRVQALASIHGRQDIVDYLGAVAKTVGIATDIGAAECADARGAASGGSSCVHPSDLEHQFWAEWRGAMRPPYPWLLSRAEVRAGLHELLVAEAAAAAAAAAVASGESAALRSGGSSNSSTSRGGVGGTGGGDGSGSSMGGGGPNGDGGSSGGPAFGHRLCGNPSCCSLDGPGALIAPRGGKTCARCRAVTYCCGVCQLADWRERHSRTCSGAAGAAAGAVGSVKAGEKRA
ncbi:hypothetical protein HXX76_007524 [Chlamydomonas incerta]|uniref:phytol kinase n=1 Tax=Chlamydomonas incerta TaxID=51695 RepID=A0A835TAT1_CHLIN|nr:hypothetical protein HXX76_007524 [Chlamydomonas incerta]|eukprot:KAG2434630.1 hypothetical protein HXX76_007524 [Chlamydomonas incerta]